MLHQFQAAAHFQHGFGGFLVGYVHHVSGVGYGGGAFPTALVHRFQQTLPVGDLFGGGCENLVYDRHMGRVNEVHSGVTERFDIVGPEAQAVQVADVEPAAAYGPLDAGGPRVDQDLAT